MNNKGNNMTQKHIDNDILTMYVKTMSSDLPTDEYSMNSTQYHEVLDHLAICEECREQASAINTLHNEWSQLRHQSTLTDEQQQLICDYLDGNLKATKSGSAETLINNDTDAMKAALHYQSHSESMAESLSRTMEPHSETLSVQTTNHQAGSNLFSNLMSLVNRFFSVQSPMVYTMSATAAVFIAVLLVTQSPDVLQHRTLIASYQDNPTIQFTEKNKLPGIGFFAQAESTSKPFEDITIELISDNVIKISWPEVDGAELYKMRIQVFNHGEKTVLKEAETQSNHATFQLQNIANTEKGPNNRYEWVLYGNTTDDRMFYASGGFIIDKGY